jgi:hypothetical protein
MACKCNLQMYQHCASNLHMPLTSMQVTVPFYRHEYRRHYGLFTWDMALTIQFHDS